MTGKIICDYPCHQRYPCSIARSMKLNPSQIKKILIIKPRGIGDVVLSTILLDNLKAHFREAKIDYLTERFAKSVVENLTDVDKVLTMEKNEFSLKVALRIKKEKYDLIIDSWCNPRTAQITFFSGVKYRVGYAYRGRKYAYNLRATSDKGINHTAEHNLELLKPLNVNFVSKKIHFSLKKDEINSAKKYFQENFLKDKLVIGIIPAGGWQSKRCDAEKWVEICEAILKKYDTSFLVLWGPGDEKDSEYIQNMLKESAVIAAETSIREMAALVNECKIIIANDSGPMHISAALGVPTLGIFGPTDPEKHGPYSQNSDYIIKEDLFCIICNKLECPYNHECMKELPVGTVLKKIEALVKLN